MAMERYWAAIAPTAFTVDGTSSGIVTVADTAGFKVGQLVNIIAAGLPNLNLKVKRVYSSATLAVGPIGGSIETRTDISAYTVLAGATISAVQQPRTNIPLQEINRAIYAEEPTAAIRVMEVDQYGNPVGAGGIAESINVKQWGGVATSLGQKPKATSVPVTVASDQMVLSNPLITEPFDYIGATYPAADTEVYTYRSGGVAGLVVGTVTVVYTDATKTVLTSVART